MQRMNSLREKGYIPKDQLDYYFPEKLSSVEGFLQWLDKTSELKNEEYIRPPKNL